MRTLAIDPHVLLMDEPFGALDPIARTLLQAEFRQILRRVRKTVVLVTHDLDEATRLGDRIAIMRSGRIVQYDTPDAVLSHPADAFVENFVGIDRALVRLSLFTVGDAMTRDVVCCGPDATLDEMSELMRSRRIRHIPICDEDGKLMGLISIGDVNARHATQQSMEIHYLNEYIYGRV